MRDIGLPSTLQPSPVADWMEIKAILSADGDFSSEGLRSALRASGAGRELVQQRPIGRPGLRSDPPVSARMSRRMRTQARTSRRSSPSAEASEAEEEMALEALVADAMAELLSRQHATGRQYPFCISRSLVSTTRRGNRHVPYIFCLLLSYRSMVECAPHSNAAARLFEHLATAAAGNYLAGTGTPAGAYRFASPRDGVSLPVSFTDALAAIAEEMGDGKVRKEHPGSDAKDDRVDVIAWRQMRSRASSTVLLLGNCATGRNMDELRMQKCQELKGASFLTTWFEDPPISPHIQACFFPHAVDLTEFSWRKAARDAESIMFDRLAVSYWAGANGRRFSDHESWIEDQLCEWRGQ